jgi:uncharacterized protein (TIGR03067 family)
MDWKQMQGMWMIVDSSRTGDANLRDLETSIQFEGDYATFKPGDGKPEKWRFGISGSSSPKILDLYKFDPDAPPQKKTTSKGLEPGVMPGIYDLNGDELVVLIDWTPGSEKRPTSLDARAEGQTVRFRLVRVK